MLHQLSELRRMRLPPVHHAYDEVSAGRGVVLHLLADHALRRVLFRRRTLVLRALHRRARRGGRADIGLKRAAHALEARLQPGPDVDFPHAAGDGPGDHGEVDDHGKEELHVHDLGHVQPIVLGARQVDVGVRDVLREPLEAADGVEHEEAEGQEAQGHELPARTADEVLVEMYRVRPVVVRVHPPVDEVADALEAERDEQHEDRHDGLDVRALVPLRGPMVPRAAAAAAGDSAHE
mmetsp:Transcript_51786/g.145455  ORF Transcript_51786/g.145455 Transcript_51786/m.145455 type:complete len:236 (+) Transcript_51786:267-974(+)